MKKVIERIKKSKKLKILSVLIVGVLFLLITRITYAYLAPVISGVQTVDIGGSADLVDDFKFVFGDPLNVNATPTTLPENGENYVTSTTATAKLRANSTNNTANYTYYLYLSITDNTFEYIEASKPEMILTITNQRVRLLHH